MNRIFILVGLLAVLLSPVISSATFSVDAKALTGLELPMPKDPDAKKYLGISKSGDFKISEIPSELIIVEIFSMYCPYCQADAPQVNELHRLIETNPSIKNKIRIIGIGTGNTPFEVEVFRKKYGVKFPLFPDEDFRVQKISSEPIRTPVFIMLKKKPDKSFVVQDIHTGESKEADAFLQRILKGLRKD